MANVWTCTGFYTVDAINAIHATHAVHAVDAIYTVNAICVSTAGWFPILFQRFKKPKHRIAVQVHGINNNSTQKHKQKCAQWFMCT